MKSSPDYVEARLQLAHALRRSGRLRESLSQYQQVATLDPRIAEGPLGYVMALVGLERYQEARDRLAEDIKVYPIGPRSLMPWCACWPRRQTIGSAMAARRSRSPRI